MMRDGFVEGYIFWPCVKVDALFSGKTGRKAFFREMKKLYKSAIKESFEVDDVLEDDLPELPMAKKLKLLRARNER
jgi:hypothetical protein